jgi:hypothetical protein
MEPLRELLAVDEQQALGFFVQGLRDVSEETVDTQELLYNASVLAHYAQVSTCSTVDMPSPATLSAVFDHFVLDASLRDDGLMMETAGAQCLLLSGFFEDQLRARHNIKWYAELGAAYFTRASAHAVPRKAQLLLTLARHFEPWRRRHARLSRELRERPYRLTPPDLPLM